jgi:hypothetical protein
MLASALGAALLSWSSIRLRRSAVRLVSVAKAAGEAPLPAAPPPTPRKGRLIARAVEVPDTEAAFGGTNGVGLPTRPPATARPPTDA